MTDTTLFQYCQKIVVFRRNDTEVLLARRKGEADYDGVYTFIGGKLETTDTELIKGIEREKTEEIGAHSKLLVCPSLSYNVYFVKTSGQHMIVPHHYASYVGGVIELSDEYSDYQWVSIPELETFSPKVDNIPLVVEKILRLKSIMNEKDFIEV